MRKIKKALEKFHSNRRAIVTLWGLIFIAMCLYVVCWFSIGLPLVYFINSVRELLASQLDAFGAAVIDSIMFALEIHPVIALIGWFVYGIMRSAKRSNDIISEY